MACLLTIDSLLNLLTPLSALISALGVEKAWLMGFWPMGLVPAPGSLCPYLMSRMLLAFRRLAVPSSSGLKANVSFEKKSVAFPTFVAFSVIRIK